MIGEGVVLIDQIEVFAALNSNGRGLHLDICSGEWAVLGFAEGQTLTVDLAGAGRRTMSIVSVSALPNSGRTRVVFAPPVMCVATPDNS